MTILRSLALFAALAFVASPAAAATKTETAQLCQAILALPEANVSMRVLKGDCAVALKDYDAAISHYRAVLRANPAHMRVRTDLSSLLLLSGRLHEAGAAMRDAVQTAPNDPQAKELAAVGELLTEAIFVSRRPDDGVHGTVSIGRLYDSNINSGSGASTFDAIIAGTLLKLDVTDKAKGQPGWGTSFAGQASYMHALDADQAVVLSGDVSGTLYDQAGEYNRIEIGLGAGWVNQAPGLTWSLTPNMRLVWRGNDMSSAGLYLDGRAQWALDQAVALVGFGKLGHTIAPADRAYDALNAMVGAGLEYRPSGDVLIGGHVVAERDGVATATEAYTKLGARIFAQTALAEGLVLDLSYGFFQAVHDQTAPVFPVSRRDSTHEVSAGLTQDLSGWREGLSLAARYSYQNVDSTLDFHDRDRHAITTSLRYSF